LTELLKQVQYQPMSVWEQVASMYAVTNGLFDKVSVSRVKDAQIALLTRLWTEHKDDMRTLDKGDKPTDATLKLLHKVAVSAAKGFEE
jgi:F-type H+-transporting ATPase subunit alpha